jgi:hypothetical protein
MLWPVSMPYAGPSPYPSAPPVPVQKRPRGWWFVLGVSLVIVSIAAFAVSIAGFLRTFAHTDAQFPDDGRHQVVVPAHVERGLYVLADVSRPSCSARDGTGARIRFHRPGSDFTYNGWIAVATFDTGDGRLSFSCRSPDVIDAVRIAAVPNRHDVARLALIGIGLPLLIGGAGVLFLIVATILWFTRRPMPATP